VTCYQEIIKSIFMRYLQQVQFINYFKVTKSATLCHTVLPKMGDRADRPKTQMDDKFRDKNNRH